MEDLPEYRFHPIRSTRNVLGPNPSGVISFEYTTSSMVMADLQQSFLSGIIKLTKNGPWDFSGSNVNADPTVAPVGATMARNNGLSQNVMANLFKSASLYINDKQISQSTQYPQHSTQMKLVYSNPDEMRSDNSAIVPIPYNPALNAAGEYTAPGNISHGVSVVKAGSKTTMNALHKSLHDRVLAAVPNWDSNNTVTPDANGNDLTIMVSLPLAPLFIQTNPREYLPYAKIRLDFSFASDYRNMLALHDVGEIINQVDIIELTYNLPLFKVRDAPRVPFSTRYLEAQSGQKILSTNSHQFTVTSGSVNTVLLSFGPAAVNSPIVDPCQFSGPFKGDPNNRLKTLYLNYSSRSYPSPEYNFNEGKDYLRAYNDYKTFSGSKRAATGVPLSFSEWLESPIFVIQCTPDPQELSQQMMVELTGGTFVSAGTYYMYSTLIYENELRIDYSPEGLLGETVFGPVS